MLTEELQNAARILGETLRATPSVQTYLQAKANCAANQETAGLEKRLQALYEELIGRQQRGEVLQRSEIEAFNNLKNEVRLNPLIQEREEALGLVKQTFAGIADELNFPLGAEFAVLARGSGA